MPSDSSGCHLGGVCYWKHQVLPTPSKTTTNKQKHQQQKNPQLLQNVNSVKAKFPLN